jgi:hypothetical protein
LAAAARRLYDPADPGAGLEPLAGLSLGLPGAHPAVRYAFLQVR